MMRRALLVTVALVCLSQAGAAPVTLTTSDVLSAIAFADNPYHVMFGALGGYDNPTVTVKGVEIRVKSSTLLEIASAGYSLTGENGNPPKCNPIYQGMGFCVQTPGSGIFIKGFHSSLLYIHNHCNDDCATSQPSGNFDGDWYAPRTLTDTVIERVSGPNNITGVNDTVRYSIDYNYPPLAKPSQPYMSLIPRPDVTNKAGGKAQPPEDFNATFGSLIMTYFDKKKPSVKETVDLFGGEILAPYADGGYGTLKRPSNSNIPCDDFCVDSGEDTPPDNHDNSQPDNPTTVTNNVTVDTDSPYKDGTGQACGGKYSGLGLFEKAVAKWFMPCEDWGTRWKTEVDLMMTKQPLGYNRVVKDIFDSNNSWNYEPNLCLDFEIMGHGLPCLNIRDSGPGKFYINMHLKDALYWLLVVIGLITLWRFAT